MTFDWARTIPCDYCGEAETPGDPYRIWYDRPDIGSSLLFCSVDCLEKYLEDRALPLCVGFLIEGREGK
jgi:hypothetical protein